MIDLSAVCQQESCKVKEYCARYSRFLTAKASDRTYNVLNPNFIELTEEGCPERLVERVVREAFGFKKIISTIPSGKAKSLYICTPGFNSKSDYYRARDGQRPITPKEQVIILEFFAQLGADTHIGFDSYKNVTRLGKP